jgi:hypothetical protein
MDVVRMFTNRKLWIGAALLIGCVAIYVASIPRADAVGSPAVCTYYATAKKKDVIGARGTGCCGEPISWGSTSLYFTCEQLYCPDSCGGDI